MKAKTFTLFIFLGVLIFFSRTSILYAQCTPESAIECPDPENNGQICPDTLQTAILNQSYSQVVTILPPTTVGVNPAITLDHIQLMDVGNLPPGISWQSNSPTNEFPAGQYSCIALDGTPDSAGLYYLRIVVDVYVILAPGYPPVKIGQQIDSTSVFMEVIGNSGIPEYANHNFYIRNNQPNPFSGITQIDFYNFEPSLVALTVFSSMGEVVYRENYLAVKGDNKLKIDGGGFRNGTYFYVLKTSKYKASGLMVKSD